jgi:hypothetical protein
MVADIRQTGVQEIELTEAMIAAGAEVIENRFECWPPTARSVAIDVFKDMMAVVLIPQE